MNKSLAGCLAVTSLFIIFTVILLINFILIPGCRYVSDASDTAFDNLKASTLLKRYEWFKDAAAQLDKKQADIQIFENWFTVMLKDYGEPREWPKDVREIYNQRQTEMIGIKSSYNSLAAEYNSAMAKINYRFCEVGDLPPGATKPLPRSFKPYETK